MLTFSRRLFVNHKFYIFVSCGVFSLNKRRLWFWFIGWSLMLAADKWLFCDWCEVFWMCRFSVGGYGCPSCVSQTCPLEESMVNAVEMVSVHCYQVCNCLLTIIIYLFWLYQVKQIDAVMIIGCLSFLRTEQLGIEQRFLTFEARAPFTNFVSWSRTATVNCAMKNLQNWSFVCFYPWKI